VELIELEEKQTEKEQLEVVDVTKEKRESHEIKKEDGLKLELPKKSPSPGISFSPRIDLPPKKQPSVEASVISPEEELSISEKKKSLEIPKLELEIQTDTDDSEILSEIDEKPEEVKVEFKDGIFGIHDDPEKLRKSTYETGKLSSRLLAKVLADDIEDAFKKTKKRKKKDEKKDLESSDELIGDVDEEVKLDIEEQTEGTWLVAKEEEVKEEEVKEEEVKEEEVKEEKGKKLSQKGKKSSKKGGKRIKLPSPGKKGKKKSDVSGKIEEPEKVDVSEEMEELAEILGMEISEDVETVIKEQIARFEDTSMFTRLDAVQILEDTGEASLKYLLKALQDQDWRIREGAAETLMSIGDIRTIPALRKALPREPEKNTKDTIEKAIKKLEIEIKTKELIESLDDENVFVQMEAIKALENIGKPAIKYLTQALNNDNWKIREGSAEVLSIIGDYKVVDSIKKVLKKEKDRHVRKVFKKTIKKLSEEY